jgi:hypothetical protein
MGLKGYRLWAMGQLDSTCRAPPRVMSVSRSEQAVRDDNPRSVALQVEFERQILKPVFHLIGYRLWV